MAIIQCVGQPQVIKQWGVSSGTSVTFPLAFPKAAFQIAVTIASSGSENNSDNYTTLSRTGATFAWGAHRYLVVGN